MTGILILYGLGAVALIIAIVKGLKDSNEETKDEIIRKLQARERGLEHLLSLKTELIDRLMKERRVVRWKTADKDNTFDSWLREQMKDSVFAAEYRRERAECQRRAREAARRQIAQIKKAGKRPARKGR